MRHQLNAKQDYCQKRSMVAYVTMYSKQDIDATRARAQWIAPTTTGLCGQAAQ